MIDDRAHRGPVLQGVRLGGLARHPVRWRRCDYIAMRKLAEHSREQPISPGRRRALASTSSSPTRTTRGGGRGAQRLRHGGAQHFVVHWAASPRTSTRTQVLRTYGTTFKEDNASTLTVMCKKHYLLYVLHLPNARWHHGRVDARRRHVRPRINLPWLDVNQRS